MLIRSVNGGILVVGSAAMGQAPARSRPDLNGIWQALNTANWDLLPHGAQAGNVPLLGAVGAIRPARA